MGGFRQIGLLPRGKRIVVLSDRDRLILKALAKGRVLRTSDLAGTILPSLPIARRRLKRLHDAALATGVVVGLHLDTRWVLGQAGRELLGDASRLNLVKLATTAELHHFTTVRAWLTLAKECFASPEIRLGRFLFQFEYEGTAGHLPTLLPHRPDAIVVLRRGEVNLAAFLEVDRATEAPAVVVGKVETTARMIATGQGLAGIVPQALLLLVPSEARLAALSRAISTAMVPVVAKIFTDTAVAFGFSSGWIRLGAAPTAAEGLFAALGERT